MCKLRTVVLREMLGNREICWSLWSGKDVMEMTSNQIKNLIKAGTKVCGLTIGEDDKLVADLEGFYCTNIMEHRHCGNYVPMDKEGCMANLFYIVIGKHEEKGTVLYDCISTKFEQLSITEADLKAYLKIGIVSAGAKLEGDKIVLADLEFKKEVEKQEEKKPEPPKAEPVKAEPSPVTEKSVATEKVVAKPEQKNNKK